MAMYRQLLPILVFSCAGFAQALPTDTNWTKTSLSAMDLAKRADDRLHTSASTSMDYFYGFKTDVGQGIFSGMGAIKSQNVYRLEYPLVGQTEDEALRRQSVVHNSNGVTVATQDPKGKGFKAFSMKGPRPESLPYNIVDQWYRNNVRYLFSAIGTNLRPFEALVKAASSSPDYVVKSESRTELYEGKNLTSYRITVTHSPSGLKKKGPLFYEIVIGDKYFFPLSMSNRKSQGKKSYTTKMFGTRWNPTPGQKFDPRDFDAKVYHVPTRTFH